MFTILSGCLYFLSSCKDILLRYTPESCNHGGNYLVVRGMNWTIPGTKENRIPGTGYGAPGKSGDQVPPGSQ